MNPEQRDSACVKRSELRRRGAVAVECALCAPLLILLAIACADFGRVAYFRQSVCNAARTAAETGAIHRFTPFTKAAWEADVYAAALAEMQHLPGFTEAKMTCDRSATVDADGLAKISVSVSYPFEMVVAWPGFPSQIVLRKTVAFRQFR